MQNDSDPAPPSGANPLPRTPTGVSGLDHLLGGGLPTGHAYLVQGGHGSGKTTLGLQFCLAGAAAGERVLYLSTCESEEELREIAASHGWDLEGVAIHYHDPRNLLAEEPEQSIFRSAEVELPATLQALEKVIGKVDPERLVIDSLTELRLLAGDLRWFRRELLALRETLSRRGCTTLFCDEADLEQPGQSVVHGVIRLEQVAREYGADRRRLRIAKVRGQDFMTGYHDFRIRTGGIEVYPRLVAAEHRQDRAPEVVSSGLPALDSLLGGGIDRSTAVMLLGPSGTGKSILATRFVMAAAERDERSAMFVFDERLGTLVSRSQGLGMDLRGEVERGRVEMQQVDPAELTAGEFSHRVHRAVEKRGVRTVVLDSLGGYAHAIPDEQLLSLHLHQLLAYLGEQDVTVLMVMAHHSIPGMELRAPFDLTYLTDSILLFHAFEHAGELRKAISVYKRRGGPHETTLRELRFSEEGIDIGEPLRRFQGVLTGTPVFLGGDTPEGEGGS